MLPHNCELINCWMFINLIMEVLFFPFWVYGIEANVISFIPPVFLRICRGSPLFWVGVGVGLSVIFQVVSFSKFFFVIKFSFFFVLIFSFFKTILLVWQVAEKLKVSSFLFNTPFEEGMLSLGRLLLMEEGFEKHLLVT